MPAEKRKRPDASEGFRIHPWGLDRDSLRRAMLAVWDKHNTSADESIDSALVALSRIDTDLERHPGRSPAYKIAQMEKTGNPPLLNLPGEVRNVIWKYANPGQANCCFTGTKTHDTSEIETGCSGRGLCFGLCSCGPRHSH